MVSAAQVVATARLSYQHKLEPTVNFKSLRREGLFKKNLQQQKQIHWPETETDMFSNKAVLADLEISRPYQPQNRIAIATRVVLFSVCAWAGLVNTSFAAETIIAVSDDASLRAEVQRAKPGTRIQIAPGRYKPEIGAANIKGTERAPITIEGADPKNPPAFEGGRVSWLLRKCAYLTLRNLSIHGQSDNGINIDDGGNYQTPSHHIALENLHVADVGPQGNTDAIKLSGVDDFVVRDCLFEGWGGQAVDMVGCHRGLIENCTFRAKPGFSQATGPQAKGGSSDIVIRRCLLLNAGVRGVQMGGSTGRAFFRPSGARYEAKNITVEGCILVGCEAPLTFVGVDGATVRYNTIYLPKEWVMRILQETTAPDFVPCRGGVFEHNLIIFRHQDVRVFVNIGSNTRPETFTFADNWWFCEDQPAASKPQLPTTETGGVYFLDPRLTDPAANDFTPRIPQASRFGATAWQASERSK